MFSVGTILAVEVPFSERGLTLAAEAPFYFK